MATAHKTEQKKYRTIYEKYYGEIPKGYHIHHKDFNPYNHSPENLIALSPEEHAKIHEENGGPRVINGRWVSGASEAGKKGAKAFHEKLTAEEKKEWHSKGGKASKNSGGYSMSENGKINIRISRLKSQKYLCPKCKHKPLDGGNFNKHMHNAHKISKENCYQWRAGAKVES